MKTINFGLDNYSIIQIPHQSPSQMMSYIITTPENKLVVIDGGTKDDASYLREKIKSLGGTVDAWLLTHGHPDHMDALTEILNHPLGVIISQIYFNFPPHDWLANTEPQFVNSVIEFFSAVNRYHDICIKPKQGMNFAIGNLKIDVLTDPNDYLQYTDINSTSVVYRFTFPTVTALFLGDLSEKAGDLLAQQYGVTLHSDIVQMAHHGQNGVQKNVYELISPKICLWPTPKWLWENDSGNGLNSGPWKTLTTRKWMDELGVEIHSALTDEEYKII